MRLIIVSNRLPLTVTRKGGKFEYKETSGGLVTGLKAVKSSLPFLWIGNISGLSLSESEQGIISSDCWELYKSVPVFISEQLNEASYNGFCNGILWPALHTFADDVSFDFRLLAAYRSFNRQFADAVLQHARPGDTVWVHDYHLMLLPQMLRETQPTLKIGFFLHTPFSPVDIFSTLPCAPELMRGVLGADMAGFHTPDYAAHFLDTARALVEMDDSSTHSEITDDGALEASDIKTVHSKIQAQETPFAESDYHEDSSDLVSQNSNVQLAESDSKNLRDSGGSECSSTLDQSDAMILRHSGRITAVRALSIGIDPGLFLQTLQERDVQARIAELRRESNGKPLILGVDRTDYIKGIPQRIRAFDRILDTHPATFVQVCVPSRLDVPEYASLMQVIHNAASTCNGRQAVPEAPMRLRAGSIPITELCALYAAADVLVVSSLMDGMNLVALEYIACQDGRGVLMLSEFAGCAATLPGAVLFNPWNEEDTAEKLKKCIDMGEKERRERFEINRKNVDRFTAVKWAQDNIECLKSINN